MSDPVDLVIDARPRDLGGGFKVRRVLPFHKRKLVGPFIFFDHFGPVDYPPGKGFDVRAHPHIGLATVTYLFDGAIHHKDTVGSDITIRPGAVNWMVAGKGIVHSERTPDAERQTGMRMHGIQTWVALPKTHEACDPYFTHHPADTLPEFDLGGARARLLAGKAWGHRSPVEFPWGIWYLGISAPDGAAFDVPGDAADERAIYVAGGTVEIAGKTYGDGCMIILKPGERAEITASAHSHLMLAGGQTMDGPRLIDWNFVASRRELIDEARADWTRSIEENWIGTRFGLPDGEEDYIALPGPG
ncbi:pirin family protein [Henriciella marina]|uniref:pirin family protein n=1 Tax=Henriciella marina TaxID=453851 RepID=UPI0003606914|nr:pirin family protein [Henriciella marina]